MKRVLKKIFLLPGWLLLCIAVPSFAIVAYMLATGTENWLAYMSYAMSAYALAVVCCAAPGYFSAVRQRVRRFLSTGLKEKSPVAARIINDRKYRALVGLYAGFFLNMGYSAFNMISGMVFRSAWFGAIAWYYLVLAMMRFLLVHYVHSHSAEGRLRHQWQRCRLCGWMLIVMSSALTAIVVLVVYRNSGFVYPGYFIYIMALYAFWTAINAVKNVFVFRKLKSPVLWAAKILGLVSAMVTMLSLETAMLTQFGTFEDGGFRRIMTSCTGGAVCVITFFMAIYMIVVATARMRKLKNNDLLSE